MSSYYTRPSEKFPPGIKYIISINVVVWLAQLYFDRQLGTNIFGNHYIGGLTDKLALWPIGSENFRPWQVITHMFAHAASGSFMPFHLLFNMFTLWMFGRILENMWGTKRFVIFYLISGLGAAAVHLLVQLLMNGAGIGEAAVGASGAVFGVLVGFGMLFPNTELYMMFIPIPIKAKWAILGFIAIDLFGGLNQSADGIAHFAHLGGALTGFILLKIWNKTNRRTLY